MHSDGVMVYVCTVMVLWCTTVVMVYMVLHLPLTPYSTHRLPRGLLPLSPSPPLPRGQSTRLPMGRPISTTSRLGLLAGPSLRSYHLPRSPPLSHHLWMTFLRYVCGCGCVCGCAFVSMCVACMQGDVTLWKWCV